MPASRGGTYSNLVGSSSVPGILWTMLAIRMEILLTRDSVLVIAQVTTASSSMLA